MHGVTALTLVALSVIFGGAGFYVGAIAGNPLWGAAITAVALVCIIPVYFDVNTPPDRDEDETPFAR